LLQFLCIALFALPRALAARRKNLRRALASKTGRAGFMLFVSTLMYRADLAWRFEPETSKISLRTGEIGDNLL
jgi:hypothetical protein